MRPNLVYRYEELAGLIKGLVDNGTLLPGSRVPSLRKISERRRTSLSTALQAYRTLEDRGVLEARPQSGFYVTARAPISLGIPAISQPPATATDVTISSVVSTLQEYANDPRFVPLGSASPSPELLAAGGLDRFLARAARMQGVAYNAYTVPRGDRRLRREIARRALRVGQALSPENIAITCGCTEALTLALKAVAQPGDTIAVESPTYFGFLAALVSLRMKALELPTDSETGVDLAALERALAAKAITACLLSSSFNNPLGCAMTEEKKEAIAELLAKHRVPLIEDDIFGDVYFGDERPKPFSALDRSGNTLYCSSFSKTLAPGYRVGWIASERHMKRILETKSASTLCGPALPQAALAEFLATGGYDSHLRRVRRTFRENVDRMVRVVDQSFPRETRISRPAGGFVLWVELPKPLASRTLLDEALAKGICFVPGDVFSARQRYANCLRLSCGATWSPRIERGVRTLGELATALARRRTSGRR